MATTGRDIFKKAMALTDNIDENGQYDTMDTAEYNRRTLPVLNMLLCECYAYSDTYAAEEGARGVCPEVTSMSESVPVDDTLARTVLPYGLAAQLMLDENPSSASFFQQRYEELLKKLHDFPRETEDIENLYGGLEYSFTTEATE
jgi:hypothetical protein